jgi:hypothetical protein
MYTVYEAPLWHFVYSKQLQYTRVFTVDEGLLIRMSAYTKVRLYEGLLHQQHALKNVNNCQNTNISLYLETSGGQNSNPYLNTVPFLNTILN